MAAHTRDKHITRQIHRLFWRANMQDKVNFILCYVLRMPAVAAYNIFIPLVSAYAIEAILSRQFDDVKRYAVWVIALALAYCICWSVGGIAIAKNAVVGSKYIQNHIFRNFLQKDYDFYGSAFFGSLGAQAARIRDAYNSYGELVTLSIPKQLTIVIAGVGVIAYNSWLLALITVIAMVFVLSFTLLSSSWRLKFRREVSQASSDVAAEIGDALTHGTTVKSFAMEDYESDRLQQPLQRWGFVQYRSWIAASPADAGRMILAALTTAALLLFSADLYREGSISITIVVLVQLYVVKLVSSTLDIAEIVKRYEETMGAAYQPMQTMLIEPTVTDPATPTAIPGKRYTLQLSDVGFRYDGTGKDARAVQDFSLTIKPGERVGIVGFSGSGKTTLTKLLLRFMDVTTGSIAINGVDIRQVAQQELRRIISYVPQEPLLFHRSIAENIAYGRPDAAKADILRAAKLAYVDQFVAELPEGYDTAVGERGIKLSGGQRQRVAIARALLKDSPILVLDEATSALDSKSEKAIQDALWRLMKGRTALVIAHRLSTIQHMDRIVVMDKGRIVQTGTHQELKDQPGIYADLWQHQSGGYLGGTTNTQ